MSVLALDLDGTICFGGGSIAPPILSVLEGVPEEVRIVLASARHPVNVAQAVPPRLLSGWDVVGANGALALRGGALVHEARLSVAAARRVLQALDDMGCAYLAYGADFVIPGRHPHAMHRVVRQDIGRRFRFGDATDVGALVKVLALPEPGDLGAARHCRTETELCVMSHSDGTFDVMAHGVDKAGGIAALGHALPIAAAFGNDANDVRMLSMSRFSVAVGDHPSVGLLASRIVPSGRDQPVRVAAMLQSVLAGLIGKQQETQA